jgi:hypothetical protein
MSSNLYTNALSHAIKAKFSFLDLHPLANFIISADQFGIFYANQAALSILESNEKEIISSSFIDLFEGQSRIEFINTCVKKPAQINLRSGIQKKNDSVLIVNLYASLIQISDNDFYQVSAVDITETVKLEEDLQGDKKRYQTYI